MMQASGYTVHNLPLDEFDSRLPGGVNHDRRDDRVYMSSSSKGCLQEMTSVFSNSEFSALDMPSSNRGSGFRHHSRGSYHVCMYRSSCLLEGACMYSLHSLGDARTVSNVPPPAPPPLATASRRDVSVEKHSAAPDNAIVGDERSTGGTPALPVGRMRFLAEGIAFLRFKLDVP